MNFEELYQQVYANIESHGQHIMGVGGGPGPSFVYTIGMSLNGFPELISFGDIYSIGMMLNRLCDDIRERGTAFPDGATVSLGGPRDLLIVGAREYAKDEYTVQVQRALKTLPNLYRLQQVLVPDPEGRWPGEPGCQKPYADVPILSETRGP